MITLSIKSKNKTFGNHTRDILIPSTWDEVTLKQYIEIVHAEQLDEVGLLAILSGLSDEYIRNAPADSIFIAGTKAMLMLGEPDIQSWKKPNEVEIQKKYYKVPEIKNETFGQKVYLQNEINAVIENKKEYTDALAYTLAIYFYPLVTGDKSYTEEKLKAFVPVIETMRVKDALPTATFFLTNYTKSLKRKQRYSTLNQLRMRLQQELTSSDPLVL